MLIEHSVYIDTAGSLSVFLQTAMTDNAEMPVLSDTANTQSKAKRKSYSLEFKLGAIKFAEERGGNRKSAEHHGVDESLVRDWRKNKPKIIAATTVTGEKTEGLKRKRTSGSAKPLFDETVIVAQIEELRHEYRQVTCKQILLWGKKRQHPVELKDSGEVVAGYSAL